MADKIKVQADLKQVQARLAQIQKDGGNPATALAAFGNVILNRIRLGFRLGRSPKGQTWLPLALRQGQPLRDTGRLQRSITMAAGPKQVVIGTNLPQAPVHQFGATIKPKNVSWLRFPGPNGFIFAKQVTIPARPFMPLTTTGDVDLPPQWAASGLEAMKKALQL